MRLRAVGITLRNCGTRNVTVQGYPDLRLLDKDRRVLDVQVLHGTEQVSRSDEFSGPPKRLEIAPGGTAEAVLVWRNITTDQATMAVGEYLSVAPAGGQSAHTLTLHTDPGNTGKFAIS